MCGGSNRGTKVALVVPTGVAVWKLRCVSVPHMKVAWILFGKKKKRNQNQIWEKGLSARTTKSDLVIWSDLVRFEPLLPAVWTNLSILLRQQQAFHSWLSLFKRGPLLNLKVRPYRPDLFGRARWSLRLNWTYFHISVFTLWSDRLCDDHGHPDMATNRTCCLYTLKMY